MSDKVHGIAVYLLIFNIVLPVFAYAFIDLAGSGDPGASFDYITQDELIQAGVYIEAQVRHELAFDDGYEEFNATGDIMRIKWVDGALVPDHFKFYKRSVFDIGGAWIFQDNLDVVIDDTRYVFVGGDISFAEYVTNATIIGAFDEAYNWTRVSVPTVGAELFFTAEAAGNNMTEAINVDGLVNVTMGTLVDFETVNAGAFINWYWGLMVGQSTYGLPIYIKWIFQIQAVLLMFTAILIGRELTRL